MGGGNKSWFDKGIQMLTHQVDKTPALLPKYEILVVGNNLGATLTKHVVHETHGHNTLCTATVGGEIPHNPLRFLYEQKRVDRARYYINSKLGIDNSSAGTDGYNVAEYLPEENAVILTNGRRIEYDQLVIATGMETDLSAVEGLSDALLDSECPVYSSVDHPGWGSKETKYFRSCGNFTHGDAFFYIPPAPFKGEISNYRFLADQNSWDWNRTIGKVSPVSSHTVINGNNWFCEHDNATDSFFRDACQRKNIPVMYNTELVRVDKSSMTLTLRNKETGEEETRDFNNLYALPTAKPHQNLSDAGLANAESNNLLDVNPMTLQHNKYSNIFGLGDCNNLPTMNTYLGGIAQMNVVCNNLMRNLKGLPLNATYNGYACAPVYTANNEMTWTHFNYPGHSSHGPGMSFGEFTNWVKSTNLIPSLAMSSGPMAYARYMAWVSTRKSISKMYEGKSHGPGYKKKWPEVKGSTANSEAL